MPTDLEGWEDGAHGGAGAADRDAELGKRSEAEDSVLVPLASCIVRASGDFQRCSTYFAVNKSSQLDTS